MDVFRFKDIVLVFILSFIYTVLEHGVMELVVMIMNNVQWFTVTLPYEFLWQRYCNPFPYQSIVSQRATNKEILLIEMLRKYLVSSSGLFFLSQVFQWVNWIRRLRSLGEGLGDFKTYTINSNGVRGNWIYSNNRISASNHDIIIFFIPGGLNGYGKGNAEMYTEYLSILSINLLEQGFGNPLIFIPQSTASHHSTYTEIIPFLLKSYQYVLKQRVSRHTQIVIAGDSTGGTLALTLLLQISQPSPLISKIIKHNMDSFQWKKPQAILLISPICDIERTTSTSKGCDYITATVLSKWRNNYVPDAIFDSESTRSNELVYYNPGMNRDTLSWKKARPEIGMFLSFGSEELVASDTIKYALFLSSKCHIKLRQDRQVAQIHNWALVNFYTEDRVDHREVSLQIYSGALSRMLLWSSSSYVNLRSKEPTNVIKLDEDHT